MAKSLVTTNGTAIIPGAYSSYKVQSNPGGLATTGVLFLIGEADAGPDYSLEADIEANAFGPDQLGDVVSKYKSGPIVDAFRGAVSASNDPDIIGSFSRAIIAKTNASVKASGSLLKVGGGTYATIADKSWGQLGKQIQVSVVEAAAEVAPTTGAFTYIPLVGTLGYSIRANGAAAVTGGILSANTPPNTLVSTIDGLTGVAATGGVNRSVITVSGTLAIAAPVANTIVITRSVAWATTPVVGDTLIIPTGSVIAGTLANIGAYVVTGATSTTVTATKLSDAGKAGAVIGTITAPIAVTAATVVALTDVQVFSPVTITNGDSTLLIDGIGKSMEIADLQTGTDLFTRAAYQLGTTTSSTFVSTAATPVLLTSATEQRITLNASRASDLVQESFTSGGEIAFTLGYTGTTGTMTINATTLTTAVTGGSGTSLTLTLSDYVNVQALVDYLNTQTGYTAAVGTGALGLLPCTYLDDVTTQGICSQFGTVKPLRLKIDAYRANVAISASQLVQFGTTANVTTSATAGQPQPQSAFYLSGTPAVGSTTLRGATTDATVTAALAKLELCRGNFIIPLFSRNAVGLDVVDGLTDASSTYTIAGIHAACKAHVLALSQYKRRKNRQAILSIQDTFANQKTIAANIASFRCNMTFQNVKNPNSTGSITTFQPWMGAVLAGSMQAAGGYKSIENKQVTVSGITQAAGDFDPRTTSNLEDALLAGLMPLRNPATGGYVWVSDQTTYGKDDNFVFNSLQAVYAADTIALTTAQRMEQAFVGQSVADINKNIAMSFLQTILDDLRRLKLISASDGSPKGYQNASIKISGNAMLVSVQVFLATAIDFIDISFQVSPVTQST
jgi:hypothetical protein